MNIKTDQEKAKIYDEIVTGLKEYFINRLPQFLLVLAWLYVVETVKWIPFDPVDKLILVLISMIGLMLSTMWWTR